MSVLVVVFLSVIFLLFNMGLVLIKGGGGCLVFKRYRVVDLANEISDLISERGFFEFFP